MTEILLSAIPVHYIYLDIEHLLNKINRFQKSYGKKENLFICNAPFI